MRTIAVLITCHNRKAMTMACLRRLFDQALPPDAVLEVHLVDDGSTDGTSDAVREAYPSIHIIPGNGTLYWAGGMRLAWQHAAASEPEAFFWLNDDTMLSSGAVASLLATTDSLAGKPCIAVGSCCDATTGRHTYGGKMVLTGHPGRTVPLLPGAVEINACDTFNGNCVLVTKAAFLLLGPIGRFGHSIGDIDYGLKARRMGIAVLVAPGYLGTCSSNPVADSWRDRRLPRSQRMRILLGRKGLPPRDWWKFLWAHAGLRAFLYWPAPYFRVLAGF